MKTRFIAIVLCVATAFSTAACNPNARFKGDHEGYGQGLPFGTQGDTDESPYEDTDDYAGVDDTSDYSDTDSTVDYAVAGESYDYSSSSSSDSSDDTVGSYDYEFATFYITSTGLRTEPLGIVNDSTMIRDKSLGGLLDFIDSEVLDSGKKMDRQLFYDLFSVNVIDSSLVEEDESFFSEMMEILTITNEFSGMNVRVHSCSADYDSKGVRKFAVTAAGQDDTWVADLSNRKFYFNNGQTEYNSTMFDNETLAVWVAVISIYFDIELK